SAVWRAQRSAVRGAVAQIEPDGTAVLVYRPGRFTLTRFRHRLIPATVPGLPVEPVPPVADALADEVEAFLATQPDPARPGHDPTGGRGRGRGEDG
ncbi:hypothetical protein QDK53_41865, partial [Amycolatopsis magusensis]|nr:hypothetical protein [Amycolatopsis magusensis]